IRRCGRSSSTRGGCSYRRAWPRPIWARIPHGTNPAAGRKDIGVIRSYEEREPDVLVDTSPRGELERLYRDQRDRMWQAVFAFAGDREVASDAVAEAFAQALRRGHAIRSPERWLWRTVFRIAAGELKRRGGQG